MSSNAGGSTEAAESEPASTLVDPLTTPGATATHSSGYEEATHAPGSADGVASAWAGSAAVVVPPAMPLAGAPLRPRMLMLHGV
jgi:hypothetical protein